MSDMIITLQATNMADSVDFYSGAIAISFDGSYATGTYWNGDHWVLRPSGGSVTITGTTPLAADDAGRKINGSMWNWNIGSEAAGGFLQGFGASDQGWDGYNPINDALPYVDERNIDPENTASSFVASTEGAFMKAVSKDTPPADGRGETVTDIALLTVVDTAPPTTNAFRPGAHTSTKDHRWTTADVDLSLVPSGLSVAGGTPPYAVLRVFRHHIMGSLNYNLARTMFPQNHMGGYGANNARDISSAILLAMTDAVTAQERETLIYSIVQIGIDVYDRYNEGGRWWPNGGLAQGYKLPLVVAATLLDDPGMKAVASVNPEDAGGAVEAFADDRQIFEVSVNDIDVVQLGREGTNTGAWVTSTSYTIHDVVQNAGPSYICRSSHTSGDFSTDLASGLWERISYDASDVGMPDWSEKRTDQNIRGNRLVTATYRSINTRWQIGAAIAANLIAGARANWNWEPFFNYADRLTFRTFFPDGTGPNPYVDNPPDIGNPPDSFQVAMMKTYRGSAQDASGVPIWNWT